MNIRIIPRLDIKGPNLVKGIHLEGLRVLGKPEHFAEYYYKRGADELLYMDVVASLYGRNNLVDIVKRTAEKIFIPLCVGGGLRKIEDIRTVLRSGADKVAINTAAIRKPEFIREASNAFGSSTIVLSIEAIRQPDGSFEAFIENGREKTGVDAIEWAITASELGVGEIMVTSVDNEGTGKGFDLELVKLITEAVDLPVIACGGAGAIEHVTNVFQKANADAAAIASMFHYDFLENYKFDEFKDEGNIEFLKKYRQNKTKPKKLEPCDIEILKKNLIQNNISCRT